MDALGSYSVRIPYKVIVPLFLAMVTLGAMAIWNKYIFLETNLPFLFLLLMLAVPLFGSDKIHKGAAFPGVTISFALFILYAWARLDNPWDFNISAANLDGVRPGIAHIVDLVTFCGLFLLAAALYYWRMRFPLFLWFLICGYIVAFIVRNSFDILGLQEGYNLSPGFVIVTLMPFIFFRNPGDDTKPPLIPTILFFGSLLWLSLIGARTAVGTLLGFYIVIRAWPVITRSRLVFLTAFWGTLLVITCLTVLYLLYGINNPTDPTLEESFVEGSKIGILEKAVGTRMQIWIHLLFLISQHPIFGYGADHATSVVQPIWFLFFDIHRDNLSAHSLYFELLYRLGVVGLLGFILIMFNVWKVFWTGRKQWAVRVAGAFLLSALFFCSTGEYLMFNDLQLRSGFGWIILGIGAGACLRARKEARMGASVNFKNGYLDRTASAGVTCPKGARPG